jgi:hypothetical protein
MRALLLIISVSLLALTAACGRTAPEYNDAPPEIPPQDAIPPHNANNVTETSPAPTPAETPVPSPPGVSLPDVPLPDISLPFNTVASFLAYTQEMFDRDNGALWGFPFHVPILVVDPETRHVIANRADPAGYLTPFGDVFYGTLPDDVNVWAIGMLSYEYFGGKYWVVMSLHSLQLQHPIPETRLGRAAHYAMHWHQRCPDFFGGMAAFDNSHMNELEARISIRLEMNALTAAFRATGETRTAHVADALAIRAERRRIFGHAEDENRFINIEGLAMYTEMALPAASRAELRARVLRDMEIMTQQVRDVGLERVFGYHVGAMYAFLLSETNAPWKQNINLNADLGYMLKDAMGITELPPIEEVDLRRFGYNAISAEERQWADNRAQILAWLTEIFINQPTLIIYAGDLADEVGPAFFGHMSTFAEFGIITIGDTELSGSFGTLNLHSGYFRWQRAYPGFHMVTAQNLQIDGNRITAQGLNNNRRHSSWTMYLNEGYSIVEYGNGYRVVPSI